MRMRRICHRPLVVELRLIREVHNDAIQIRGLLERHPEYKEMAAGALEMWNRIREKDAENRKAKK